MGQQTVRYRYRVYPTMEQERLLNRLFGCCRVVWNDTITLFRTLLDGEQKMPPSTAIQKTVLADAKKTPERAFLTEVSNVALLQAHRDALQACWNGVRKDRHQRFVRYRSLKHNPINSARFTRNGFTVKPHGVFVAKIGILKTKWSRQLPSAPSSCTVIHEPNGRWYVSFVVTRETTPLPRNGVNCAIDLGFTTLGSYVDTDGNRRPIENPRNYTHMERRLTKAQRKLARQKKGSNRYDKQKLRIAKLHAKAHDRLADYQNKQALQIVRDTQAVALETLNVHGMAKRHGKSVLNAAPSAFATKIEQKAEQYERAVIHIGRFQPSTRLCSICKHYVEGGIPEEIRTWQCKECHTILDRDYNAAVNILDAAGLAESLNAHGDSTRLRLVTAKHSSSQGNANPTGGNHKVSALGIPVL